MTKAMQQEIRSRLEGLEGRIVFRSAKRAVRQRKACLLGFRNDGLLDDLSQARAFLADKGLEFQESAHYGLKQLHVRIGAGVDLWYDGMGKITYPKRRRVADPEPNPSLFSESVSAASFDLGSARRASSPLDVHST